MTLGCSNALAQTQPDSQLHTPGYELKVSLYKILIFLDSDLIFIVLRDIPRSNWLIRKTLTY